MYCKHCGQEVEDNAKFCEHCGGSLKQASETLPNKRVKKAKKPFYKRWWFWVIVVFLVIGSAGRESEASTTDPIHPPALETTESPKETDALQNDVAEVETTASPTTEDDTSLGEKNALRSAKNYLNFSAFSYSGLIDQLEYEGYTTEEAIYAVDNCGADWFAQALRSALSYLDFAAFSYAGLIDQLEYEGFTTEEATYGADNCGADWNEQAAKSAQNYLEFSSFSRQGLIDQLLYEGFTQEQAEYGVNSVGY